LEGGNLNVREQEGETRGGKEFSEEAGGEKPPKT